MSDATHSDRAVEARILDIFDSLTEGERRLAEVVLETQGQLHSFTASELAARAHVSNATAARFFRHLGYDSYNQARLQSRRDEAWGSPLYELTRGSKQVGPLDLLQHLSLDIQNLSRTASLLRPELLQQATSVLAAAPTIWVVGFRNSYVLASYARALLVNVKSDIRLLPVAGMTLAEDFASLKPEDALFVVGFRRRSDILRALMERVDAIGAKSIFLTDLTASHSAKLATVTLRCHSRSHTPFDSYTAPISVINHLCAAVGMANESESAARFAEIEELHEIVDKANALATSRRRRNRDQS